MALNIPGLNADLLAKLKNGDLKALESLFRAAYPVLIAKAKETLDDDGAAARVVERLIPKIFAERSALTTPEAFGNMLDGAVHEAAVRERSRLAGIRKKDDGGKKSTVAPSVDDVWAKVAAVIQGPSEEALAQAAAMKEKLAHEAAGHIKQMTKTTPWYVRAGAGVVLIGVVAGLLFVFAKSGEKGRLARQIAGAVKDIKTGTGQRGNVTLDDGTKAMFGADTRVVVIEKFNEQARGVGIEGAAEFTPVVDAKMPFQVLAGGLEGGVMLTSVGNDVFAVRQYKDEPYVIVRVKSGTVKAQLQEPNEGEFTLNAGDAMTFTKDGKTAKPTTEQLSEAFGYIADTFAIDQKSLKHTLGEIKRWYGTELFLKDTTLGGKVISVTAPLGSTTDAIKAIETASGLVFGWEGQTMVLKEPTKK